MSQISHLLRMFAYDDWANREVIANLSAIPEGPPQDALRLIAHVLGAESIWLNRIEGRPDGPVWPGLDLTQCLAEAVRLEDAWKKLLNRIGEAGLEAPVHYVNSKGEAYDSRVEDILQHVLFHSHYHRGQVARAVRAAGHAPAYTDYIHAVRQAHLRA